MVYAWRMTRRAARHQPETGDSEVHNTNAKQPSLANSLSHATLWKAVEATSSPLIVTDSRQPDEPIIYCNQAFVDLSGYPKHEIIGRNCRFLQGEGTDRRTVRKMRSAIAKRQSVRVEVQNYRKDGAVFWNDLVMSPVFDDAGQLTNYIGLQLDITDRVTYQQQLVRSQKNLERSNKELEQFTYAASHDLQEPLRMVSSYLQLIEERYKDKLDADGEVFIGFATDGAKRMQALVNDLLSLSRVRTSARSFAVDDTAELLAVAIANLQASITESGAVVTHEGLPKLPVDRTQIIQLFQNLVGNAIKYRKAGTMPQVHIRALKRRNHYEFRVSDNGIGIEPAYFERIFGVFQRLHTRSEYPGTGVGLAICSKIIERHGGEIRVESSIGEGSTFIFTLPTQHKGASDERS